MRELIEKLYQRNEISKEVMEVIGFIKSGDDSKAILFLNYIMEDIEMYKRNSL